MEWQQLITDIYVQTSQVLEKALEGLTLDDLDQQPHPDCNSMGWLTWHLTRGQDRAIADLMGGEQLWVTGEWHTKFNRPPDPKDTGFGHSSQDLAEFKSPDVRTLLEYHHAVLKKTLHYINNKLTEADLEREFENPVFTGTIKVRRVLVAIISDNLQHVGQIAYVRGLLKGKGWSDI